VAKLPAEVAAAREIQCIKEVMVRQAQKAAADQKKKLQDAERKAKDAASNLQVVVEGKSSWWSWANSVDGVFWYTKHVHYTLVWICVWN
jgi:hypothetical protein